LKNRLALLTSGIINPFLVGLGVVMLVAWQGAASPAEALKWVGLVTVLTILPVFIVTLYLMRNKQTDSLFINERKKRTRVYLITGACSLAGFAVLYLLDAPRMLLATFTASIVTILLFMLINLWWKISVHTAWMGASVTILIVLYGWVLSPAMVLVPISAWSRIQLGRHSLAQTAAGACLAAVIALGVFSLSGVI
jgi:membrane-associated phospholipid phosphatase